VYGIPPIKNKQRTFAMFSSACVCVTIQSYYIPYVGQGNVMVTQNQRATEMAYYLTSQLREMASVARSVHLETLAYLIEVAVLEAASVSASSEIIFEKEMPSPPKSGCN
jgi:hypothetical protein